MQTLPNRKPDAASSPAPATPARAQLGAAAEALAAEYLHRHGLSVIARNLRCKFGELDLVCLDTEVLVIVEVRLRRRNDYGGALASVTWRKRRKLIRATRYFWQRHAEWRARRLRFDVVALGAVGARGAADAREAGDALDAPTTVPEITWIKDAFRAT